jgi:LacI family transcriptional regulator
VSIRKVALEAGVSSATVSRVINHPEQVTADTRERVVKALRKTGYVRQTAASALARGSSRPIAVLASNMSSLITSHFYQLNALLTATLGVRRFPELFDSSELDEAGWRQLSSCAGILYMGNDPSVLRRLKSLSVLFVQVSSEENSTAPLQVSADYQGGGYLAARHLWECGCRSLGFLAQDHPSATVDVNPKLLGMRRCVAELAAPDKLADSVGTSERDSGFQAWKRLRAKNVLPDGVLLADETVAVGFLQAVEQEGVRLGSQIKVICYDDFYVARHAHPPLTAVIQQFDEIGRAAVSLLLEAVRGDIQSSRSVTIRPRLIIRESTCAV